MKKIVSLFIAVFSFLITQSHPWKPDHFVIIDTDCGLDDYRAINMLLASSSVRVLAIISSDGVLNAKTGYYKIKGLTNSLHMEGLLIGANNLNSDNAKNCKPALDFVWNDSTISQNNIPSHLEIIKEVLENSTEKIKFINLGTLSTYNDCYENIPSFSERIEKAIWSCDYSNLHNEFNFLVDSASYKQVIHKNANIEIINGTIDNFSYKNEFISCITDSLNNYTTNFISSIHTPKTLFSKKLYDENTVLYLHFPEMFTNKEISKNIQFYTIDRNLNSHHICDSLTKILQGKTALSNQVFNHFPLDDRYYIEDVKDIKSTTIRKFGMQEWTACVITNELHRHIGAYSIVGAKMGIRAMEYFGAGTDELEIVSCAGSQPPFSCLNDGIQVSTGGTIGHGLITIKNDTLKLPQAEFTYMGRKISISLKEKYRKEIEEEIRNLVIIHGIDSNIYWDLVRNLALYYWAYWDRNEIFTISEKKKNIK